MARFRSWTFSTETMRALGWTLKVTAFPAETIEIELTWHRSADLNVDGQHALTLQQVITTRFGAAAESARFVRFGPRRFHHILKSKFGLSYR